MASKRQLPLSAISLESGSLRETQTKQQSAKRPTKIARKKSTTGQSNSASASSRPVQRADAEATTQNLSEQHQQEIYESGLARSTKADSLSRLRTSTALRRCSGHDIVRKGTQRKSKYLLALPMNMIIKQGGKIGELTDMDTKNPSLYVDIPQGKIKLVGHIIHTSTRFITLQCHPKRASSRSVDTSEPVIVCEDIFDKIIVFTRASCVGAADDALTEVVQELQNELENPLEGDAFLRGSSGKPVRTSAAEKTSAQEGNSDSNQEPVYQRRRGKQKSYNENELSSAASASNYDSDSDDENNGGDLMDDILTKEKSADNAAHL